MFIYLFRELAFQTSASEAAILTMPHGATAYDLKNTERVQAYIATHIESWYRYANGVRGRKAMNGDIRIVIGCDKATCWGMATFNENLAEEGATLLKFLPVNGLGPFPSATSFTWECSSIADVKVGPNTVEMEELRIYGSNPARKYANQCLFVRTLNPTLSDDRWQKLEEELALENVGGK